MNAFKHLLLPSSALYRRFPSHALSVIEAAVADSETRHRAEIRFAIEVALDVRALWRIRTPRERALEVFSELRVWDTAERNGVLVYILLAERDVEIVADRGFDDRVTVSEWEQACQIIERGFREQRWRDGALGGIEAIAKLLEREFPASGGPNPNEQPNRPAVF